MKKKDVEFCLRCARPLDKRWNKHYDGTLKDFCNSKCRRAHRGERGPKRVKNPKGEAKKENGHRDFFNGK